MLFNCVLLVKKELFLTVKINVYKKVIIAFFSYPLGPSVWEFQHWPLSANKVRYIQI